MTGMLPALALVRAGSGHLHVGQPTGRGYPLACYRPDLTGGNVRAEIGDAADRWWRAKPQSRCPDCEALRRRGWRTLVTIAGW